MCSQLGHGHPRSAYIRSLPAIASRDGWFICGLFLCFLRLFAAILVFSSISVNLRSFHPGECSPESLSGFGGGLLCLCFAPFAACRAVLSAIVLGTRDEGGRPCEGGSIRGCYSRPFAVCQFFVSIRGLFCVLSALLRLLSASG
jgi:hypothetical protein